MTFGATKNKFQIKWTIHLHILSIEKNERKMKNLMNVGKNSPFLTHFIH